MDDILDEMFADLPEKYYNFIINNPNKMDMLIPLKLIIEDLKIPAVIRRIDEDNVDIGLLWNKIPKLLGETGDFECSKISRGWTESGYYYEKSIATQKELEKENGIIFVPVPNYKIQGICKYIFLKALGSLFVILKQRKYDTSIGDTWLSIVTFFLEKYPKILQQYKIVTNLTICTDKINDMSRTIESIPSKCKAKSTDKFYEVDKALLELKNTYSNVMENVREASGIVTIREPILAPETTPIDPEIQFKSLLKQKIRKVFHQKLPEKYWNLIDGVENPMDDREILCKLALDAKIPVIISYHNKNGEIDYDIGILWNEIPKLVGVTGTAKQIRDKAHDWKTQKWVESEFLLEKSKWFEQGKILRAQAQNAAETAQNDASEGAWHMPRTFSVALPDGYSGQIQDKSVFLKLDGIPELIFNLKRQSDKYNISILAEWLKAMTLAARELPRVAYETHVEINNARELAAKEEQLREARRINIEQRITVDRIPRRGYIYAKASPMNYPLLATKFGRASEKDSRLCTYNTGVPIGETYLVILPVEDAILAENILFRFLDAQNLRITPRREWFLITNKDAVNLIHKVANMTNNIFATLDDATENYIKEYISNPKYTLLFDESIEQ